VLSLPSKLDIYMNDVDHHKKNKLAAQEQANFLIIITHPEQTYNQS
jgi:hypothetical protein